MDTAPAWVQLLPSLNALFNATSAALLLLGYRFIRQGNRQAHRRCMLSALTATALFLVGYLSLHYNIGSTRFGHTGLLRISYMTILLTHTILAIAAVPMVALTLARALRGRFDAHAQLARWTLPVWLYVSVTGVIIYVMLYHVPGAQG